MSSLLSKAVSQWQSRVALAHTPTTKSLDHDNAQPGITSSQSSPLFSNLIADAEDKDARNALDAQIHCEHQLCKLMPDGVCCMRATQHRRHFAHKSAVEFQRPTFERYRNPIAYRTPAAVKIRLPKSLSFAALPAPKIGENHEGTDNRPTDASTKTTREVPASETLTSRKPLMIDSGTQTNVDASSSRLSHDIGEYCSSIASLVHESQALVAYKLLGRLLRRKEYAYAAVECRKLLALPLSATSVWQRAHVEYTLARLYSRHDCPLPSDNSKLARCKEARTLYTSASSRNHANATYQLAVVHIRGVGERAKGEVLMKRAADMGVQLAKRYAALMNVRESQTAERVTVMMGAMVDARDKRHIFRNAPKDVQDRVGLNKTRTRSSKSSFWRGQNSDSDTSSDDCTNSFEDMSASSSVVFTIE